MCSSDLVLGGPPVIVLGSVTARDQQRPEPHFRVDGQSGTRWERLMLQGPQTAGARTTRLTFLFCRHEQKTSTGRANGYAPFKCYRLGSKRTSRITLYIFKNPPPGNDTDVGMLTRGISELIFI